MYVLFFVILMTLVSREASLMSNIYGLPRPAKSTERAPEATTESGFGRGKKREVGVRKETRCLTPWSETINGDKKIYK